MTSHVANQKDTGTIPMHNILYLQGSSCSNGVGVYIHTSTVAII